MGGDGDEDEEVAVGIDQGHNSQSRTTWHTLLLWSLRGLRVRLRTRRNLSLMQQRNSGLPVCNLEISSGCHTALCSNFLKVSSIWPSRSVEFRGLTSELSVARKPCNFSHAGQGARLKTQETGIQPERRWMRQSGSTRSVCRCSKFTLSHVSKRNKLGRGCRAKFDFECGASR